MTDLYQELQEENEQLRRELELWKGWYENEKNKVYDLCLKLTNVRGRLTSSERVMGEWLAAALEDPNVNDKMKADIKTWFEIVVMP